MTKLDPTPPVQTFIRDRISRGLFAFTLGQQQRCPFCHDHLNEGEALVACSACRAVYHRECLGAEGECLTYGCPHGPTVPRRSSLRDRWSRGEPWSRRKKAVALGLMLTGLALAWLFVHPPHTMPPGCPAPPPNQPHVALHVLQPQHGLVIQEGQAVWVRGNLRIHGSVGRIPRSVVVHVDGRVAGTTLLRADLSFGLRLTFGRGTHWVRVTAPGSSASPEVEVHVEPTSSPTPPVRAVLPELDLVGRVRGSEVMVRGKLRGEGPVDITIRGGGQSLTYQSQAPGPFATVITLPRVGTHAIEVSVRDARGRIRSATGKVRRLD